MSCGFFKSVRIFRVSPFRARDFEGRGGRSQNLEQLGQISRIFRDLETTNGSVVEKPAPEEEMF